MKLIAKWIEKMHFAAEAGGLSVPMDAKPPIGSGVALTPKDLVLAGLCGCTGMDVVALLRKNKQSMEGMEISAEATPREGSHPMVFREVKLIFEVRGPVDRDVLLESVRLSQTKYCGVSAMLARAFPINYEVRLNSETIGTGSAEFSEEA
jgi:putative redox protein